MNNAARRFLESVTAVATFATIVAACNLPSRQTQTPPTTPVKVIHMIQEPDVCDIIITDANRQLVCTGVTHIR